MTKVGIEESHTPILIGKLRSQPQYKLPTLCSSPCTLSYPTTNMREKFWPDLRLRFWVLKFSFFLNFSFHPVYFGTVWNFVSQLSIDSNEEKKNNQVRKANNGCLRYVWEQRPVTANLNGHYLRHVNSLSPSLLLFAIIKIAAFYLLFRYLIFLPFCLVLYDFFFP